jgi:hypothetical protein
MIFSELLNGKQTSGIMSHFHPFFYLNRMLQLNLNEHLIYHYIFECTNLSEKRTSLLPKHLIERPNKIKFKNLMTSERKPILQKL